MIDIHITNQQHAVTVPDDRIRLAVQNVLDGERIESAAISIAIVDDSSIHSLNRQYLEHDYPTDVLSFVLERDAARLEGEIVASGETAAANAQKFGWAAQDELLLYVIHGTLHLLGYDDHSHEDRAKMRARERHYLAQFGLLPRYEEPSLVSGDD